MSRRSRLIRTVFKHVTTEAKSTIATVAKGGFNSVGDYLRESAADPNRQLNIGNLLSALKSGAFAAGQQRAIEVFDRSKVGAAED